MKSLGKNAFGGEGTKAFLFLPAWSVIIPSKIRSFSGYLHPMHPGELIKYVRGKIWINIILYNLYLMLNVRGVISFRRNLLTPSWVKFMPHRLCWSWKQWNFGSLISSLHIYMGCWPNWVELHKSHIVLWWSRSINYTLDLLSPSGFVDNWIVPPMAWIPSPMGINIFYL